MFDLEKIKTRVLHGEKIEDVIKELKLGWKGFEDIVAAIFEANNFTVERNFRFKTKRRYEIDIIAIKRNNAFCIDCKQWGGGRYKKSPLSRAAEEQKKRTDEFDKFLKSNIVAREILRIDKKRKIHPIIVTLLEEEIVAHGGVFIIPLWKLNSFLLSWGFLSLSKR